MPKNIRRRYIGPCYTFDEAKKVKKVDLTAFILRLLLFDTYILNSNNLREFDSFIKFFGYGGIKEILSSGAVRIHCEVHLVVQTGQTGLGFRGKKRDGSPKDLLPLNSYSFDILMHTEREKVMHKNLQRIHRIKELNQKEAIKLKKLITDNLVWYPQESTNYILNQLINDFRNNTTNIKKAVISKVKERLGVTVVPNEDFSLSVEVDDENDIHVTSELSHIFGFDEHTVHKIVEGSLLAIGGLNKRIETMRAFSAVTGFRNNELNIFEDKIEFIVDTISPGPQEKKLNEILSWSQFPNLDSAIEEKKLNIESLLKVRESAECTEFRNWLWNSDSLEVNELKERLESLSVQLSLKMSGKVSKVLRWLTTTGVGFIPHVGLAVGPALGLLDTFLLNKLLPESGILTFLGRIYPTIFKGT